MLNYNLVKLYVHCEINETIEMTFKIETKLDTWHINCKFKKIFWKKKILKNLSKKKFQKKKIFFDKICFPKKNFKNNFKNFSKNIFFF